MSDDSKTAQVNQLLDQLQKLVEKGDYQNAYQLAAQVLGVDPENEIASNLRGEIERRNLIMKSGAATSYEVKQLTCPSCGATLNIHSSDTESIGCSSCGAVTRVQDRSVVDTLSAKKYPPMSFISLGDTCTFFKVKYQAIGRIRYVVQCREWDDEDNAYYTERWIYDEWVMVGENKEYAYLYEDAEGYAFSEPFTPTAPNLPSPGASRMTLMQNHPAQRVQEEVDGHILYLEGEMTWTPKRRERIRGFEYKYGYQSFSAEARLDDNANPVEVEFFKSTPQSLLDIAIAFKKKEIIEEEQRKEEAKKESKLWSWAFFGAGALLLVMMISSFFPGRVIASYDHSFSTNNAQEGVIKGPFELAKKTSVYTIELSSNFRDNAWAWGGVELLDESQAPVNAVEGEFWRESGYDSDGRWSESDLSTDFHFRLDTPGTYYVRLVAEPGTAGTGKVRVKVFEGTTLTRYYLLAMLLCFGFGFGIRKYKSLNPWYALVGLLLFGVFLISMMAEDD